LFTPPNKALEQKNLLLKVIHSLCLSSLWLIAPSTRAAAATPTHDQQLRLRITLVAIDMSTQ
jgi:hypothetical protein